LHVIVVVLRNAAHLLLESSDVLGVIFDLDVLEVESL